MMGHLQAMVVQGAQHSSRSLTIGLILKQCRGIREDLLDLQTKLNIQ
jgi:hypothetical protein